jgi:spore germination protein
MGGIYMTNFLTNKQISFILYCIIIGYGITNLPKNAAEVAGTGMWLTLLITTIIFMFITYMVTYLQYVFEGETIFEYSNRLVGSIITYLFIIIMLIYFFIYFSMIIRLYGEVIKLTFLFDTPVAAISLLFFIVICYALTKGINVIARICEIYGLINLLGFILISSLLITTGKLINIKPLFVMENLTTYLKGVKEMVFPFLGMEALLFLPISRTKNKKIFKYTTFMVGFIGIFYIFVAECTLSVVGAEALEYIKESMLTVIRGVDIYYLEFLRRMDGLYVIFWTMNILCAVSLWGYGITLFTSKIIKKLKFNFIAISVTALSYIASQISKNKDQIELILKYNSYLGIVVSAVIPGILLMITKVKKYDKQK